MTKKEKLLRVARAALKLYRSGTFVPAPFVYAERNGRKYCGCLVGAAYFQLCRKELSPTVEGHLLRPELAKAAGITDLDVNHLISGFDDAPLCSVRSTLAYRIGLRVRELVFRPSEYSNVKPFPTIKLKKVRLRASEV